MTNEVIIYVLLPVIIALLAYIWRMFAVKIGNQENKIANLDTRISDFITKEEFKNEIKEMLDGYLARFELMLVNDGRLPAKKRKKEE